MQELGGSTGRQTAKLANGNILYHTCHAQIKNGGWLGARKVLAFLVFWEFESSLVQEFKLFWEFGVLGEFCEIRKIQEFGVL